ncbi:MAG: hypothetical protein C0508_23465 [Cyanobacteria bacterium PR.023]|nr:hypothetical protein [Cyanobacteria bacterium PR.023]
MIALPSAEQLAKRIIAAGLAAPETMVGCSELEISALESRLSIKLPSQYRKFLLAWGKEAGDFLDDSCFLFDTLESICRTHAEKLAKKHGFQLGPQWFVFLDRYPAFLCFDTTQGEDPPVWLFDEDQTELKMVTKTFSEWLNKLVNDEIGQ